MPVAPSTNAGKTVSSAELFAVILIVPGIISPVPSNDVPPILLAVAKAVAVGLWLWTNQL